MNVTIERNHAHSENMTRVFETAKENATKAIKLFETLTAAKLRPEQWNQFCKDPAALAKGVILDAVKVPDNLNRAKYLELIQLPDFSELRSLCSAVDPTDHQFKTDYFTPLFLAYDGTNVKFTDMVETIIESKNIRLSETEHELYQLLDQFAALQNLIISKAGEKLDLIKHNSVLAKGYGKTEYKLNPAAFKAVI